MYPYLGDFPTGATIFVPFQTFNSSGASVTITGLAVTDIEVYKGASMTQRASDAGYALVDTDGIDLDTITGIHGFTIDTSDNTDAGFYAAGSDYTVVVSAITVDSQTVNFIAARFSIDNRGLLRPTTAGRTLDVTTTGEAGVDFDNVLFAGNGPIPAFGLIDRGTAQAADANGITLRAGFSTAAANMVGVTAWIYSSTNGLHARGLSTAYNDTTKVLTLSGLGEAPTGTVLYALFGVNRVQRRALPGFVYSERPALRPPAPSLASAGPFFPYLWVDRPPAPAPRTHRLRHRSRREQQTSQDPLRRKHPPARSAPRSHRTRRPPRARR